MYPFLFLSVPVIDIFIPTTLWTGIGVAVLTASFENIADL